MAGWDNNEVYKIRGSPRHLNIPPRMQHTKEDSWLLDVMGYHNYNRKRISEIKIHIL